MDIFPHTFPSLPPFTRPPFLCMYTRWVTDRYFRSLGDLSCLPFCAFTQPCHVWCNMEHSQTVCQLRFDFINPKVMAIAWFILSVVYHNTLFQCPRCKDDYYKRKIFPKFFSVISVLPWLRAPTCVPDLATLSHSADSILRSCYPKLIASRTFLKNKLCNES